MTIFRTPEVVPILDLFGFYIFFILLFWGLKRDIWGIYTSCTVPLSSFCTIGLI